MTADIEAREAGTGELHAPKPRRRKLRRYDAMQRAEAVALAATVGPVKAGAILGVPRRTVADWTQAPAAAPVIAEAERSIADRLREAHSIALAEVLKGVQDPDARLLDKARALEVLGQQLALAEGRATARTENLSVTASITEGMSDADRVHIRRVLDDVLAARGDDEP